MRSCHSDQRRGIPMTGTRGRRVNTRDAAAAGPGSLAKAPPASHGPHSACVLTRKWPGLDALSRGILRFNSDKKTSKVGIHCLYYDKVLFQFSHV